MKKFFVVEATAFTCGVEVENGIIIKTPPILRNFIGQNFNNLISWLEKNKSLSRITVQEIVDEQEN